LQLGEEKGIVAYLVSFKEEGEKGGGFFALEEVLR